ncbi:MAG: hypothetical protein ACRD4H_05340 [Candidatus Acidiferrales bacterium]
MSEHDLPIHFEGHPGRRGNVLADALVAKLRHFVSVLGQADRRFSGQPQRQTDYEVSGASKTNPTQITLHPVPRQPNYNPIPAFSWAIDQIDRIASGKDVDDRIDATFAETLAIIAKKKKEDDYTRLWITRNGLSVTFDEEFRIRSEAIAIQQRESQRPQRWFQGIAYGSVVGDLRQVADIEGEHQFVIVPPIGAEKIECTFPHDKRDKMREFLWRTVRVIGKLTYLENSPFPIHIEMEDIEPASEIGTPLHLLDLRGLFKGRHRSRRGLERLLNGL